MTTQRRFLNVKPEEWRLILPLIILLSTNSLVFELADVVATAGFISNVGTPQILILWLVTFPITMLVAGGYATIVDRMKRVPLMSRMLLGFAGLYAIVFAMFAVDLADEVKFPALAILTDLQLALFPLAFWAMANDLYTLAQTRRLFPILATGGALGSIAGNVLAAVLSSILPMDGGNAPQVLGLGVVIFLGGFVVLQVALRNYDVRARQSRQVESMAQTLKGGMDVVRNVPMFRFLALAMILAGLSLTVIEFHFLYTLDLAAQELDDPAAYFQTFFGLYKAVMIASILAFQSFITSRYLDKLGISNSFLMLPIGLLLGAVLVMVASTVFAPGLLGVAAGRLIARMVQKGWDEPARKSAQGLIPDERRGRVATIMDNYFYATATIIGSLLVGALLILTGQDVLSRQITTDIYLGIAVVCALGAIYAAYKLRGVYDQSLLNWRLSRSRRKSVLDGLDFDDVRSAEEKAEDTQRRRTVLDGMTFDKLGTITPPPIPAKDIPHPSPEINEEPNAPAEATDTPTDASDTPQRRRRSAGASPLDNLSFDDDDDDTSAEQRAETKRKRKSILDDLNLDDL